MRIVDRQADDHRGATARPGIDLIDDQTLKRAAADAHLLAMDDHEQVAARCSLWWRHTPALDGQATGFVGHYAAADAPAGHALLAEAAKRLTEAGAVMAIGPIDGSTWRNYRFITARGDRPPFLMEPDHPDDWPAQFERAGFAPLATYFSAEAHDLTVRVPKLTELENKLKASGLTIRPIDVTRFDDELARMHGLSASAFADNFLYTPIEQDTFVEMYRPIRKKLVPKLVMLAEMSETLVGFVFGMPNLLQPQRGETIDTVIIKTLAVRPGRQSAGLGGLLMELCQRQAHAMGYSRAIHALMHESNKSRSLSAHYAEPFRQYTLFSKRLDA